MGTAVLAVLPEVARSFAEQRYLLHGALLVGVEAVRGLTIAIEPGLITGMLKATSGRILFGDQDITTLPPSAVARLGIARSFQNIRLLKEASVLDNIVVGFHCRETTRFIDNLLGLPAARRERRGFVAAARDLVARFRMEELADRPAGTLSYGHQRWKRWRRPRSPTRRRSR